MWGLVCASATPEIALALTDYEAACDVTISPLGYLTVCAYPADRIPASLAIDLMRSHAYLLTDREFTASPTYARRCADAEVSATLSEQVRIESEVRVYRQKLDFFQVVSHEVRNPLTIIRAYGSMLLDSETDEDKRAKLASIVDYATVIDHEISHVLATEEMLAADALWSRRLLPFTPILDEVLEVMTAKARTQNIRLVTDIQLPHGCTCIGNRMALKLVFSNILSNAIKYSPEGSQVYMSCRADGPLLTFVVEDHGVGMTEEQLARLFRKYEKFNQEATGQGIGLYMVKMLVDKMGGSIDIQNRVGEGTRVQIELPIL
ncbi:MAG: ATP-binding protein [Thermoflavifilum sp.]|nr:ATP-binding protein [Thermoflavifilum sp.]MCL6514080.1 ATP-binding protein [Alicyclobacillus sp.]